MMSNVDELELIGESIIQFFEQQNEVRDQAIQLARVLTRQCANTIRAIHRSEWEKVKTRLNEIRKTVDDIKNLLEAYPDLYYAGYTQDALKEYAETLLAYALIRGEPLPTPESLGVIPSTYINGLSEAASELRRRILDIIRHGHEEEAERLLDGMDAIYTMLITIDYPDSITGGLRRRTDALRSVLERTRGEYTVSLKQQNLEEALEAVYAKLGLSESQHD